MIPTEMVLEVDTTCGGWITFHFLPLLALQLLPVVRLAYVRHHLTPLLQLFEIQRDLLSL